MKVNLKICLSGGLLATLLLIPELHAQLGVVRGEVMDEQGNAIKDVLVRIEGMSLSRKYRVKTDGNGRYYHGGVNRGGTYRVIAQKKGFRSDYVEGVVPGSDNKDENGVVDFVLVPGEMGKLAFEMTDREKADLEAQREAAKKAAAVRVEFEEGMQFYNQGQYQQAVDSFKAGLEKDPAQPVLWANLGNTYSKMNQNSEAVGAYQKAIELSPEDPTLHQNLGSIYSSMGEADQAKASYEKAASLAALVDPRAAAMSYYNMGVTFINNGQNQEALEALSKAVEMDPTYAEAHYQLALTLLGANQMDRSVEHLQEYLDLAPTGPNAEVAKQLMDQLKQ